MKMYSEKENNRMLINVLYTHMNQKLDFMHLLFASQDSLVQQ